MLAALEIARRGLGRVEPNPMVGCILVHEGVCIGQGYHSHFGGPHAERAAVDDARRKGYADRLRGSTAYVTLEPCCHQGKTPPCTRLLLDVGVRRVVVGLEDPFPDVAGKGFAQLRASGVQVEAGVQAESVRQLLAPYLKRTTTRLPWIIAKWAMSLDGRIATRDGASQWISNTESRAIVHQLRSRVDAIVVGRGTALADDPLLTARLPDGQPPLRTALRVVVDSNLSIDPKSQLVQTAQQFPTLIWSGPTADTEKIQTLKRFGCEVEVSATREADLRLDGLLKFLVQEHDATNVLVEGGSKLLGSLLDLRQIDECHAFIGPKLIGGSDAPSPIGGMGIAVIADGPRCIPLSQQFIGQDIYSQCRIDWLGR